MNALQLMAVSAAMVALPIFATSDAAAQQRPTVGGLRITPSHANLFSWERGQGFQGGVFIIEREIPIIVEREVVREVPAAPPVAVAAPAAPRKPYVIGGTYASLPGGCMKMIEDGASYYFCGWGEWYRRLGDGSGAKYRAVARP